MSSSTVTKSAFEAVSSVDPQKWNSTGIEERLRILRDIQANLLSLKHDFGAAEAKMRNDRLSSPLYSKEFGMLMSVVPVGNNITASIELYETLLNTGKMIQPLSTSKVRNTSGDGLYMTDIHLTRNEFLRVRGEPIQTNPMDKKSGIIATIGAGNFSGSQEIVKALFYDNCVVVHKPHPLIEDITKLWEQALKPLVDHKVLAFCHADQGPELVADNRLSKIHFTGGSETAELIAKSTSTPLASECGGNNPVIVVPGDWTDMEMKHQAMQIASNCKLNGGAACGRGQTIVTSRQWSKREKFLQMIEDSIVRDTFAAGSWYPGGVEKFEDFRKEYPNAKILEPEGGKSKESKCLFIVDDTMDGYSCSHEAFSQVLTEIPLDVPATAKDFLPVAVKFCNEKLWGSLDATVLSDDTTQKQNEEALSQAVTNLKYGTVAINGAGAMVFCSPCLVWGGNEADKLKIESGKGNFGNLLGFENVEKSIVYDDFVSLQHLIFDNRVTCDAIFDIIADASLGATRN